MNNKLEETLDRLVSLSAELVYKAGESQQIVEYSNNLAQFLTLATSQPDLQTEVANMSKILPEIMASISSQDWVKLFDVTVNNIDKIFRKN